MQARALQPRVAAARPFAGREPSAAQPRGSVVGAGAARGVGLALSARRATPAALQPPHPRPRRAPPRAAPCRSDAAATSELKALLRKDLRRGRRDGTPAPRQRKAAAPGQPGEKKPRSAPVRVPDPRTVAFLVEKGVGSEKEMTALLSRVDKATRDSHANALAAWDWLHAILAECAVEAAAEAAAGGEPAASGAAQAAAAAAAAAEELPAVSALPPPKPRPGRPRKGEGEPFTAAGAVREAPELLYSSQERLVRAWAFLRAPRTIGGAGRGREAALVALFRFGRWVMYTPTFIFARAEFLESEFGMADGMEVALHVNALLHFSEATLRSKAAALRAEGLDAPQLLCAAPRLASVSAAALREKASWLRDVAGLSAEQVNAAPALLAYSLSGRVRPRYFFAARLNALDGRALMTFCYPSDFEFLSRTLRHTAAATWSVDQYRQYIEAREFAEWADAQEAQLRRKNAKPRAQQ